MGVYIGDLLNKIRFDKNLKPEEFSIVYYDRIQQKTFEIPFVSLSRSGNFIVTKINNRETMIPLHRIREVRRNGKLIWSRDVR